MSRDDFVTSEDFDRLYDEISRPEEPEADRDGGWPEPSRPVLAADIGPGSLPAEAAMIEQAPRARNAEIRDFRKEAQTAHKVGPPFSLRDEEYVLPAAATRDDLKCSADRVWELAATARIVRLVGCSGIRLFGYDAHREDWLKAHFAMNLEGELAPMFRVPRLQPPKMPSTRTQAVYALDRQLIDLHWLHSACRGMSIQQDEFSELLSEDEFDWLLAMRFALSKVRSATKVERWLALSDVEAWQMACLHTATTRARLSVIRNGDGKTAPGADRVRAALRCAYSKKPGGVELIERGVAYWTVAHMMPSALAADRAILFASAIGSAEVPEPHIFQRQQDAVLRAIKREMER